MLDSGENSRVQDPLSCSSWIGHDLFLGLSEGHGHRLCLMLRSKEPHKKIGALDVMSSLS